MSQSQAARWIQDLNVNALKVVVLKVPLPRRGTKWDRPILTPIECIATAANAHPLSVLLRKSLSIHRLQVQRVAIGVDDDERVSHHCSSHTYLRRAARAPCSRLENSPGCTVRLSSCRMSTVVTTLTTVKHSE